MTRRNVSVTISLILLVTVLYFAFRKIKPVTVNFSSPLIAGVSVSSLGEGTQDLIKLADQSFERFSQASPEAWLSSPSAISSKLGEKLKTEVTKKISEFKNALIEFGLEKLGYKFLPSSAPPSTSISPDDLN